MVSSARCPVVLSSGAQGRHYEDHTLLVAEYCTSSGESHNTEWQLRATVAGVDTPNLRQIDKLRRMNGSHTLAQALASLSGVVLQIRSRYNA